MTHARTLAVTAMLVLLGAAQPVLASSTAASSASDSLTASVGSSATSIERSSKSSTKTVVGLGDYRVIDVATVADRPGLVRVTLRALQPAAGSEADDTLALLLPQAVATQVALAAGHTITASARPYGVAFAMAGTADPFFLVLDDERHRELGNHVVTL